MSNSEDENLKIVKTMAENGILGRWDIVRQYVSDDMVMHVPPSLPFGRDYLGWDDYLQMFKELATYFTDLKAGESQFATCGNKVIVMSRLSGRVAKNGKTISIPITAIWEVKEGKVVDIVPYYYDTKAICDLLEQ
jgi:uncharacterized protein